MAKNSTILLLATTLLAGPAWAQTTIPSTGQTDRPAATSPSGATGSGAMSTPGVTAPQPGGPAAPATTTDTGAPRGFMAAQEADQWRASKLIGTRVVSQSDEAIGDVNDVVLTEDGRLAAIVIGVGGFLGIGEKSVAVPPEMLDFSASKAPETTGSTARPAGAPAAGGDTAGAATRETTTRAAAEPNRIVLKTTKAELQSAPTFKPYDRSATGAPAATGTPAAPDAAPAPRQ